MPSTVIQAFHYEAASRELLVVFRTGRRYVYRGVPAETSGEDNLKTFALVDAAYEAAATHAAAAPKAWQPETGAGTARDGRRLR